MAGITATCQVCHSTYFVRPVPQTLVLVALFPADSGPGLGFRIPFNAGPHVDIAIGSSHHLPVGVVTQRSRRLEIWRVSTKAYWGSWVEMQS